MQNTAFLMAALNAGWQRRVKAEAGRAGSFAGLEAMMIVPAIMAPSERDAVPLAHDREQRV